MSGTARKAVTTTAQVGESFNNFRSALSALGSDVSGLKLMQSIGEGYELVGVPSNLAGKLPVLGSSKESVVFALSTFTNAVNVVLTAFPQTTTEEKNETTSPRKRAVS